MQPTSPCLAPAHWWRTWASGLLLHWELHLGVYSVGFFFPPPCYVAFWDSKTPHRPADDRVSCCLETSPPSRLPPQDRSLFLNLLSLFLSFIFCPTSFQREWVPGVLRQHSEVVLWTLLSIQMIFWWISGRESCLFILIFTIFKKCFIVYSHIYIERNSLESDLFINQALWGCLDLLKVFYKH